MTPEDAFKAALVNVRIRHGEHVFPASTVEHFAHKRWEAALLRNPAARGHAEFAAQAVKYCEYLLLDEVLKFEKVKRGL